MTAEEYTKEYWLLRSRERRVKTFDDRQLTFLDWLWERYQTTPITLRVLCKHVAKHGSGRQEYEKQMEWYRRRYRAEMEQRNQLINNNPFKEEI